MKNTFLFLTLLYLSIDASSATQEQVKTAVFDTNGKTVLINAILENDQDLFTSLLRQKELINLPEKTGLKGTPLMYAASAGHLDMCKALIAQKAQINKGDLNNDHALNWAAFSGNSHIITLLLAHGADLSLKSKHGDAIDVVYRLWHHDTVARPFREYLASKTAIEKPPSIIQAVNSNNPKHLVELLKLGLSPDSKDLLGIPALQLAAQQGRYALVKILLEYQANPNVLNRVGQTPLSWAARYGHIDIVNLLIAYGAAPNHSGKTYMLTPLMAAAVGGHYEVASLLLKHQAKVDQRDKVNNATPAHWAIFYDHSDLIKLFIAHGADYHQKALENDQYSVYEMAIAYQKHSLIQHLDSLDQQHLIGSWKVKEIRYHYKDTVFTRSAVDQGRFVFSDKNYSLIYNPTMKKRVAFDNLSEPSEDEIITAYRSLVCNTGHYVIEENVLITTANFAKVPGFEGGKQFYRLHFKEQCLELEFFDETYPNGTKPNWYGSLTMRFILEKE